MQLGMDYRLLLQECLSAQQPLVACTPFQLHVTRKYHGSGNYCCENTVIENEVLLDTMLQISLSTLGRKREKQLLVSAIEISLLFGVKSHNNIIIF